MCPTSIHVRCRTFLSGEERVGLFDGPRVYALAEATLRYLNSRRDVRDVSVIAVVIGTFVAIITEKLRAELAALTGCCILLALRMLSAHDLFPVFGNEAIITVGAMFVLSAAVERTGVIASASRLLETLPVRSERFVLLLLPPVVAVSAFVNNTPVVVVFLPIIVTRAKQHNLAASKLLMPLSFASILGGSTAHRHLDQSGRERRGSAPLGVAPIGRFKMAPVGLLLAAVGLVVLFVFAPRLLPRRETVTSPVLDGPSERQFLTAAYVPAGSGLIGRTARSALSGGLRRGRVLELVRHGEVSEGDPGNIPLEAGDRLRVSVDADSVAALKERVDSQCPRWPRRTSPSARLSLTAGWNALSPRCRS